MAFGWLSERSAEKNFMPQELSRNQSTLRFDVILQHNWPMEQCLLHTRVVCGRKTKSPCFDLFTHLLIKQTTKIYRNHFSIFQGHTKIALFDFWIEKLIVLSRNGSLIGRWFLTKITIIFVAQPFIRISFFISGLRLSFSIVKRPSN